MHNPEGIRVTLYGTDFGGSGGIDRYTHALCNKLRSIGLPTEIAYASLPRGLQTATKVLGRYGSTLRRLYTFHPLSYPSESGTITHLSYHLLGTSLLLQNTGRVVVTIHDLFHYLHRHDPCMSRYGYTRLHAALDSVALRGCRRADAIITSSEDTKRHVVQQLELSPDRVHVVHLGVDLQQFRRNAVGPALLEKHGVSAGRYILHVGSQEPRKNLERLLRAFATLRLRVTDAKLLRVGKPYYVQETERLHRLIETLYIEDAVYFIDTVTDDELVGFYNLADLFVLPSLHEGFGLPVLEAFACGTPVVCSNAGALPEIAGDAAILVAPKDVGALAEAMEEVLTDAALRKKLSDYGQKRARQLTWDETAHKTAKVYWSL